MAQRSENVPGKDVERVQPAMQLSEADTGEQDHQISGAAQGSLISNAFNSAVTAMTFVREYLVPPSNDRVTALSLAVEEREKIMRRLDNELRSLRERNGRVYERHETLKSWRHDLQQRLRIVGDDLRAAQPSLKSNTLSENDIISAFKRLDNEIDILIEKMLVQLTDCLAPLTIGSGLRLQHKVDLKEMKSFLTTALHRYSHIPLRHVVRVILQHHFRLNISKMVFSSFSSGMSQERDGQVKEIYKSVLKEETPERTRRWRAMTYSQVQPEPAASHQMARDAIKEIQMAVGSLTELKVSDLAIMENLEGDVASVFAEAVEFWKTTQLRSSSTMRVFFRQILHSESTQSSESRRAIKFVLPTGFGLLSPIGRREENERSQEIVHCLVNIRYVDNDWAPKDLEM